MKQKGYKELRKDPEYTEPLPTDVEFIGTMLNLELPGMEAVRCFMEQGDIVGARDAFLHRIEEAELTRYYFGVGEVPQLMKEARSRYGDFPEALQDIAEAERIAEGDIPLFKEKRAVFPGGAYDWNSWLYDSSQYQLHLTRFAYLKRLSRGYCLTGNEKFAECFSIMMEDFIDDNPVPRGGIFRGEHCTWDPLSVGVRLFMLPEAFIVFYRSKAFTPEIKMKLIKSFYQHGEYVRKYHAQSGNHVCMQLRGLIQVSLLLPELKPAQQWLEYARRELPGHIRDNVYEDGAQFEGSSNYHQVVMRDLYELVPLFQKLNIEALEYSEILEKMLEVQSHLMTPDMQLARFGDTDAQTENELRNTMSLGAYLFGRGDFKFLGHPQLPFALLWRLGPEAAERYEAIPAGPAPEPFACFPVGGYLFSRQSWEKEAMYMAMRAGVGIGGHAHSDTLSLILYAGGRELLADSGMGLFEWNKERKYAVSTRAHNTVVVDGQDQHVRGLHWNTTQTAACKIWDARHGKDYDYWFASHYGYTRYDDPVIHSRKVVFVKNRYWLIVDLFEAQEQHTYEQYFHLPIGDAVVQWDRRQVHTNHNDSNVLLLFPEQERAEDQLALESGLDFRQGQYYVNPVAKRSMSTAGRAVYETLVVPYGTVQPQIRISRMPVTLEGRELSALEATALRISGDNWSDEICLYHNSVDVNSYLDHTGNIVSQELLPGKSVLAGLEFAGGRHSDDVIVNHSVRQD
ncbi:alginate lyase family protein [Paenibacillus sp. FSL M7-1046]|uniref:alginate lyase family protein n=1 Tax=Paenibacillus sp. FSL M7-1046 TaxID=2975315 RepID=UPI0030F8EC28